MPRPEMRPRLALAGLIAAYIGLSVAVSFATRMSTGPDEPAHFIYVRSIGSHFALPMLAYQETRRTDEWADERYERRQPPRASHEAHQPPLYYAVSAIPYYAAASFGVPTHTVWRVIRLFTVLLGAGWLYFLYRLSREFFRDSRYAAVVAAACVGLLPSAVFIGGVVNNDVLICLLFTAASWLLFKSVRRGEMTRRSAIETGVVAGLAMLAKAQGSFLLPLIALAALVIARRRGWKSSGSVLASGALTIAVAVLISCIWFARNWYVYGSPVIQSLHNPLLAPPYDLEPVGWVQVVGLITEELFNCFWTPFWLIEGFVNRYWYTGLLGAMSLAITAGVVIRLRPRRKGRAGDLASRADAWALLALPVLLIYVFLFRQTIMVDKGTLAQGRLLLPAAGLLGVSIVGGLGSLIRRPPVRVTAVVAVVLLLLAANIVVLRWVFEFYRYQQG